MIYTGDKTIVHKLIENSFIHNTVLLGMST